MKAQQGIEALAARIRAMLPAARTTEKRMFGGITFLFDGNMLCCTSKKGVMFRVGKEAEAQALSRPFAEPCLGTGRRMPGFVMVGPAGIADETALAEWIAMSRAHVDRLTPKASAAKRPQS